MSTARKVTARGVVISRQHVGEGSVKVLIYTDVLGLVWALAQSARMERSQLRPHLIEGTRGVFSLLKGRDVWRTTGATETTSTHFDLAESPEAQKAAARVLSFVKQFVRGEGSDPYFFETLWQFMELLPYADQTALKDAECVAVLRMLAALGYIEGGGAVSPFLALSYDPPLLSEVRSARSTLVKAINEGMTASGLS